jgi:phage baseplate assembly protein W
MAGISPRLPLGTNSVQIGYALNTTIEEAVKQNLKTLLLTNPGEKTFDSKFGVGLKRYLFRQSSPLLVSEITERINEQVRRYMTFLLIRNIQIKRDDDNNALFIGITYFIQGLGAEDVLQLNVRA